MQCGGVHKIQVEMRSQLGSGDGANELDALSGREAFRAVAPAPVSVMPLEYALQVLLF